MPLKARYPPITVTAGTTKTQTNKKNKKKQNSKKIKKSKYNKNDDVVRNYSEMLYEKYKKARNPFF